MIKIGDRVKFVSVDKFIANMKKSGKRIPRKDIEIQKEIANDIDKIVNIGKGYFTENRHCDMIFFIKERLEKVNKIDLDDELFKI